MLFLEAVDTSGEVKDKEFIAAFMTRIIAKVGQEHVVAVCMDGACMASFPIITAKVPHVFCYICPTHSFDNFLKNVCSDQEDIGVKAVRTGDDGATFKWGSSVFSEPIEQAWEVIKFVIHHAKPLAFFRAVAKDPATWEGNHMPGAACELVKFCETRFASKLLMLGRYLQLRPVLEVLVANPAYKAWLSKQKLATRDSGEAFKLMVQSGSHWKAVILTDRVLAPVLKLLRLTDGKTGATLGKVYHLVSTVAQQFDNPIEGMDDTVRENMSALFMARWTYFHEPVFTAAYYLDPEFIRGSGSAEEDAEFKVVMKQLCTNPGCKFDFSQMTVQWAALQTAIAVESHGMNLAEAFAPAARRMPAFEWARTFLIYWPAIQYAACRLPALACSASGCEHSWSIEGWIHSKKRNRLGQQLVECLVRTHTNIELQYVLDLWRSSPLPWELDMEISEPVEEDEDSD
jgi:hypothetical protein